MSRLQKRRLAHAVSALVLLLVSWYLNKHPQQLQRLSVNTPAGSYRVSEFVDGDTVRVNMNGRIETIRFIGLDTPETHDPRKAVQCFGKAAAAYTKNLIGNNAVRLEADPLSTNRDRYDRLLRYVYLPNGQLVQAEVIKSGYGFAYISFPFTKSEEFVRYQTEARQQNKGLWGSCQPNANDFGGFTSNPE